MAAIAGTSGDDNLTGTLEGDDVSGSLGADTLTGGGGADLFYFNDVIDHYQWGTDYYVFSNDGCDVIKDFSAAEDSIINFSYDPYSPYSSSYKVIGGLPNVVNPVVMDFIKDNFASTLTNFDSSYLTEISVSDLTSLGL